MRPILLVLFGALTGVVGACSGAHDPNHDRPVPISAVPVRPAIGLNVPSLLSLSIDEMTQRVGPLLRVPPSFADPTLVPLIQRNEPMDSTVLLQRHGLVIVVAYDYHTRRVTDLLLLGGDEDELMRRAQLQLGAAHYLVLPVYQAHQPTQLMGLRVLLIARNQ